jgi:hypothetical protein
VFSLFVVVYLAYYWRSHRTALAFGACSLAAATVMLFTVDQTRVFAVLSFPLVLLLILRPPFLELPSSERPFFENVLALVLLAALLAPDRAVGRCRIFRFRT